MCDIWKLREKGTLAPEAYAIARARSSASASRAASRSCATTSRTSFAPCTERAVPQIVVSTNGYREEEHGSGRRARRPAPRIGIGLSLDGVGEAHDRIRGLVTRSKSHATATTLKERGMSNLRFSFTISKDNVDDVPATYELAHVDRALRTTRHNSQLYYHTSAIRPSTRHASQSARLRQRRELARRNPNGGFAPTTTAAWPRIAKPASARWV